MASVKRENNELNTRLKQLEIDMKRGGGVGVVGASADDVCIVLNSISISSPILSQWTFVTVVVWCS